jgi:hypothetical protein
MENLNLRRLWEVCNMLSDKEQELSEKNIYISLLGNISSYSSSDFENFLEDYSFKIEKDKIIVFNNDEIPYEDYSNNDFSYVPIILLSLPKDKFNNWISIEVELELERQKREKEREIEDIKHKINFLTKKLNDYETI